ncbi:MAG: sigma-54 dependent transcriptional regulator [Thermodesulfobacteriota bacterium]|nr:sigma-54 dependent transcriptional regulator [Thermodesulfobacteriota bacterium]
MEDRILIAEDEIDLRHGLKRMITMEIKCEAFTAANAHDAIEIIRQNAIDLLLSDIRMPDMDGLSLLREVKKIDPAITVIMMTAFGSIELAVQAIKDGAYDFIRKPLDEKKLFHLLRKGLERNRLVRENARLMKRVREKAPFHHMIGQSEAMQKVFRIIQTVAHTDITVLLLGQSGTGKEMAARAIHDLSDRHHRNLVTVNCPALPEHILESELFGYRKGAFTNAAADKIGLFETAHRGTVFLDEIGDLSLTLQTKLLRAIQEKEIKPLGDNQTRKVDVRIIASTNQDLRKKIVEGTFREDLYYRIKVATLVMPPIDERREDLPLLVDHFLSKIAGELDVEKKHFTTEALNKLLNKIWPGNVRELENTIYSLTTMVSGPTIEAHDLPPWDDSQAPKSEKLNLDKPYKPLKNRIIKEFSIAYINNLLAKTRGNIALAARTSGIKRQSLQKIIKRYRIDPEKFRT